MSTFYPEGYDWEAAFDQATVRIQACAPGIDVSKDSFTIDDIVAVDSYSEGANDYFDWLCFGVLDDGRWFMLRAGCDYTGWDCRAWGIVDVAPDRDTLLRYGVTPEEKERLDLS